MKDIMTKTERKAIESLRHKGYAVIVWTPEELEEGGEDLSAKMMEDCSIEYGAGLIKA